MHHYAQPPLYASAIEMGNQEVLNFLLKQDWLDPLKPSEIQGIDKNALHLAVDHGNVAAFLAILEHQNGKNPLYQRYNGGEAIIHYMLKNASTDFLAKLQSNEEFKQYIRPTHDRSNEFCASADLNGLGKTIGELCYEQAKKRGNSELFRDIAKSNKSDFKEFRDPLADVVKVLQNYSDDQDKLEAIQKLHEPTAKASAALATLCLRSKSGPSLLIMTANMNDNQKTKFALEFMNIINTHGTAEQKDALKNLLNSKDDRRSLLYLAAQSGNRDLVTKLISNQANIDEAGPFFGCSSAITVAARNGHYDIVT